MSPTREEKPSSPDNKHVELKWFPLDNLPIMFIPEQQEVVEKNIEKITSSLNIKD